MNVLTFFPPPPLLLPLCTNVEVGEEDDYHKDNNSNDNDNDNDQ